MPPDAVKPGSTKELTSNQSKHGNRQPQPCLFDFLGVNPGAHPSSHKAHAETLDPRSLDAFEIPVQVSDRTNHARKAAGNHSRIPGPPANWTSFEKSASGSANGASADAKRHFTLDPWTEVNGKLPGNYSILTGLKSNELAGKRIVIDAGHGGWDAGARYGGTNEKDINLDMARLVANGLRERGAEVIMTRDSDQAVDLGTRYQLTRKLHPDAFLSIHSNASPKGEDEGAYGIQTHFFAPQSAQYAKTLSQALSAQISPAARTVNQGTFDSESSDFYVLKNRNIPSALVEIGFVSNRKERNLLNDPAYRQRLADALIGAEASYLTRPATPQVLYAANQTRRKGKVS